MKWIKTSNFVIWISALFGIPGLNGLVILWSCREMNDSVAFGLLFFRERREVVSVAVLRRSRRSNAGLRNLGSLQILRLYRSTNCFCVLQFFDIRFIRDSWSFSGPGSYDPDGTWTIPLHSPCFWQEVSRWPYYVVFCLEMRNCATLVVYNLWIAFSVK